MHSTLNRPQGSGHSLGSSAAAAFVPSAAAAQVPEVDPSQPTTQVRLSRAHRLYYPQHQPTISSFLLSGCCHTLRRQARAHDAEPKLHRCALGFSSGAARCLRMPSCTSFYFGRETLHLIPAQSAICTLAYPNSRPACRSRWWAGCPPSRSPTMPQRWPQPDCSTPWCGRQRAKS
jgi:hypothetical protein